MHGFGAAPFGAGPFGAGPFAFRVLLVTPLNSNTLRVFLSAEPRHQSRLSSNDVLNRRLWTVAVLAGPGELPNLETAENALPQPTAVVGAPGAWSVDLRFDTRVLLSTTYEVVASPDLVSLLAVPMAVAPWDRGHCLGIAVPRPRRLPRSSRAAIGVDFFYDSFAGAWRLDGRRDVDVHAGNDALRKRIIRRLITGRGAFRHLPTYGLGLQTKELLTTTHFAQLRAEATRQLLEEEDVDKVEVQVYGAPNRVVVTVMVKPKAGPGVDLSFEVPAEGPIVVA